MVQPSIEKWVDWGYDEPAEYRPGLALVVFLSVVVLLAFVPVVVIGVTLL